MDPDVVKLAQVLVVVGSFGAVMAVFGFVGKLILSKTPPKAVQPEWTVPRIDEDRFARLENAVDAIAIEIERMSEAQRFSAKLMSERLPASPPDKQ